MTPIDHEIVQDSPGSEYSVDCHHCGKSFNASTAAWCRCEAKLRTLTCPHCSSCFCRSPALYKTSFWEKAPRALRENTNRFRIGDGAIVRPEPAAAPAANAPLPRVLIVDDEEDMRSLVVCYVEQMGYDVTSVTSPADALAYIAATAYEVVITDALMPGMDGRELCQQLKTTYGDKIKVIVMTSLYTASRYKTEARFRFGADEYLAKPLHFAVLKAALDRVAPLAPPAL